MKILWLAGNLNHYKARFLNHLAKDPNIELTIISGTGRDGMGDLDLEGDWEFEQQTVPVTKNKFGTSGDVRTAVKKVFSQFEWVLIPMEKKNLLLFLYLLKLRKKHTHVKLISYNHPILKSGKGRTTTLDKILTRFFYSNLDRVIFYTQQASQWAVENSMISKSKAFWANNTIDTTEIDKHYAFELPPSENITFLFIGRLIPSKRVDALLQYFTELKLKLPTHHLKLEIIGDGPDRTKVLKKSQNNPDITWHGAIVDEEKIAPIMHKATFVFVPGLSGLSINHSFAYGRPYLTMNLSGHGPEIVYLEHGINGYFLKDSINDDLELIINPLKNRSKLNELCLNAYNTGRKLSLNNWVKQMSLAFKNET